VSWSMDFAFPDRWKKKEKHWQTDRQTNKHNIEGEM
jgi:hypothetical protein